MTDCDLSTVFVEGDPQLRISHWQRSSGDASGPRLVPDAFEVADCLFLHAYASVRLQLDGNYTLKCSGHAVGCLKTATRQHRANDYPLS